MTKTFKPAYRRIINYYGSDIMLPLNCMAIAADRSGRVYAFEYTPEYNEHLNHWESRDTKAYYLGKFNAPLTKDEAMASLWIANEFHFDGFELAKDIEQIEEGRIITINSIEITVPVDVVYVAADVDGLVHAFTDSNIMLYGDDVTWRGDDGFKMLLGRCDAPKDADAVYDSAKEVVSDMEL